MSENPLQAPADERPDTQIGGALAQLDGLDDRPLEEHVAAYDGVHRALQDALALLDDA